MPKLTTTAAARILAERGIRTGFGNTPYHADVAHWCRVGLLPAERIRGHWYIDQAALEAFQPPHMGRKPLEPLELKTSPQNGACSAVGCNRKTKYNGRFCITHERRYYRQIERESYKMNVFEAILHNRLTYADFGKAIESLPNPSTDPRMTWRYDIHPNSTSIYFSKQRFYDSNIGDRVWTWDIDPQHVKVDD
jgi:hypothetical protein